MELTKRLNYSGKLFLILIFIGWDISYAAYTTTQSTAIRTQLLTTNNYDALSRPSAVTNVQAKVSFLSISDLELKGQKLVVAGWLTLTWIDSRLTWTPASYGDIEYIFLSPSTIWKPEVVVDNSIADLGVIAESNLLLRVKYNGVVEWEPPKLFTVHCSVDVTYYPFDQQKCSIEIISWGFRKDEVTLSHLSTSINRDDYVENGEWEITDTKVGSSEISEEADGTTVYYPQLEFFVYLKRRPEYHTINTLLPIYLSAFLLLVVFKLPADSGEKASYALTMLLALAVLLTIINDNLPETSISTSILGVYLACTLVLASAAIAATVWILVLHHRQTEIDMSGCNFKMTKVMTRLVCLPLTKSSKVRPIDSTDEDVHVSKSSINEPQVTWQDISIIWDEVFFYFFLISNILVTFICMMVLGLGSAKPE